LQVAGAIRHEGHLLVHRNPLIDEKLVQAALRFFVMPRNKAKSPCWPVLGHGLADDHLEIRRSVGPTAHIAAIDADRHGRSGDRHLVQFGLTATREHDLLGAELGFETLSDTHRVIPDRRRVHGLVDRQYVCQQGSSDTVGRERSPTRLKRKEIRRDAFK